MSIHVWKSRARSGRAAPSLWGNRNFVLLWSGQVVSQVGSGISQLALPLLVLALTGSPAQAGFILATRLLPYLACCLPAGALVDRWDRQRVMIVCDAGRALVTGSIPLAMATHHLTLLQLYLVSLVGGTLYVFYSLAQTACLPRVVAPEHFRAAMALNEAIFSLSLLLGPALAGVLWGVGHALPFVVDAVSYAGSVLSLCFMRMSFQEARVSAASPLRAQIAEGLRWLWGQPVIRFVSLITGGYNFLTPGVTLILIVLAQGQHISARALGAMLAMAGVGGLLGALACPWLQRRLPFARVIRWSCVLLALVWPLFALARGMLGLALVLAVFSALDTVYNVVQYTYRLARIPDALQGRVNSIVRLLFNTLQTLGLALTGVLLERLGPLGTIVLYAGGFALAAVVVALSRVVGAAPTGDAAPERVAA